MNRRGFTLIELLAVIVIIGILGVLIVPGLLQNIDTAKQSSYDTLIKNIITSSQLYYEECEYGDLSDDTKYGTYSCQIISNGETAEERKSYIETTLGTLANTGFLTVNDIDPDTNKKIVINPINDNDISGCKINIIKKANKSTYKVTYKIENTSTDDICPNAYE